MDAPTDNLPDNLPKKPGRKIPVIPIEDLIEYRQKNLSTSEIAQLVGCSQQNVATRLAKANLAGLDRFRNHKDKVLEHLQRKTVKSIVGSDYKSASLLQKVTATAILEDKIRTIRGQATEIVDVAPLAEGLARVAAALRAAGGEVIPAEYEDAKPPQIEEV